jgi:hypothetical protein
MAGAPDWARVTAHHVRTVNFAAHLGADRVRRDRHLLFGFLRHAGLNL